jgi:hypothetical protein
LEKQNTKTDRQTDRETDRLIDGQPSQPGRQKALTKSKSMTCLLISTGFIIIPSIPGQGEMSLKRMKGIKRSYDPHVFSKRFEIK